MRAPESSGGASPLAPTARRILDAAKAIVAERGYTALTMAEVERASGVNRALVSYYFGGKPGLVAALVDSLFRGPRGEQVEEIRDELVGSDRTRCFLEWQKRVSADDRVNRTLFELLPHALRDPRIGERFADEYRRYRAIDADCLSSAPVKLTGKKAGSLAAVTIAIVDGIALQRVLDPAGFDFEGAWNLWGDLIGQYLQLSRPPKPRRRGRAGPKGRTKPSAHMVPPNPSGHMPKETGSAGEPSRPGSTG
ncbi:MAG: TetR/AcrR family transcriptional regulator [Gaiellaceae bacterium]|jgi:AcrR family transcriptional regulator